MIIRLCLLGLLLLVTAPAWAQPSRGFTQETGRVAGPGQASLDLYNSTGEWTRPATSQLRVGTRLGEFWASTRDLGYKALMRPRLAAYVSAGVQLSPSHIDASAGLAYTLSTSLGTFHFNPAYVNNDLGKGIYLNAAGYRPLPLLPRYLGPVAFGVELSLSDATDTLLGYAVGARWLPKDYLTVDLILWADGGTMGSGTIATPAALRINISL